MTAFPIAMLGIHADLVMMSMTRLVSSQDYCYRNLFVLLPFPLQLSVLLTVGYGATCK